MDIIKQKMNRNKNEILKNKIVKIFFKFKFIYNRPVSQRQNGSDSCGFSS
jgi:hypothetical protein